ncbi:MAG: serine/threonine protein kinase [Cyanobacteria bacterium J06635_15]
MKTAPRSLEKIFIDNIHQILLPGLTLESQSHFDPVVVHRLPSPWQLVGAGNYAAVFCHPDYADYVIKVYAPGRPGWLDEVAVYQRLGQHPAFSTCFHAEPSFLVLKRLAGVTLYDCLARGKKIPGEVIQDVDQALAHARDRGLNPHDIHGRNVMMYHGRGLVVDVSDFLKPETCTAWNDLRKAYYWFYRPFLAPLSLRVPYRVLNWVRKGYRWFRRMRRRWSTGRAML